MSGIRQLTRKQVLQIRELREKGVDQTTLGVRFGVSQRTISAILAQKIYKYRAVSEYKK